MTLYNGVKKCESMTNPKQSLVSSLCIGMESCEQYYWSMKFSIYFHGGRLSPINDRTCFLELESTGLGELGRLVNIVTKGMVDTFDKVTDTIVECLLTMENSTLNSSKSNQVNSNFATHDFDITNDQIKCIAVRMMRKHNCLFWRQSIFLLIWIVFLQNIFKIIIEHNRDLQWWFEDIGKTLLSLIAEARDCATYTDSNRTFVLFHVLWFFFCGNLQ